MDEEEEEYSKRPSSGAPHNSNAHGHGHGHRPASTAELMGSAKVLAGAAQSAFSSHSAAGIDKARVSEAAEELLEAAKKYGKLEGSGFGSYLDKAEGYLHNLHDHSSSTAAPQRRQDHHRPDRYEEEGESRPTGGSSMAPHQRQEHRPDQYEEEYSRPGSGAGSEVPHRRQEHRPEQYKDEEEEDRPSSGGDGGGGIGDYIKMAQGFLK